LTGQENYAGKDELIDELLKHDVILKVNVGMNATDPVGRVQNLVYAISNVFQIPGMENRINTEEVAKEIFGQLGYKDGERFITEQSDDPEIQQLQAQIQQLQMGMEKDAGSLAIKQNEAIIKQQDADTRRAELMLQRDALINQIISQQSEPVDKDNVSKAGTMARDKYNKVPYAQG
jgi:hypothetical protein